MERIKFSKTLFEKFIEGLSIYKAILSQKEIEFLPISCALMPFMHGLRALTDYLNGNIYYKVSYQDLINKELIHFSIYDNLRSIPSLCDGLKPSQRKILYYMLKKNKRDLIKVAQLSGYVSAETSYHHGEASLNGAIIGMAQDYVGSNNINILEPAGNFGTKRHF